MPSARARRWILGVFVGLLALSAMRVYWPLWNDFRTPNAKKGNPSLTLDEGREIRQVVRASGEELTAVAFWLDQLPKRSKAKVKFQIQRRARGRWVTIVDRRIPLSTLRERSQPARIMLKPPLRLKLGEPIAIALTMEVPITPPVRWRFTGDFAPEGFRLYVNNHERRGTAQLRLDYRRASGPLLANVDQIYERATVFAGPVAKSFLFAGLVLVVLGLVLLFLREPEIKEAEDEAQRVLGTTKKG